MTDIESRLVSLCEKRAPNGSVCPSETARALWPSEWRQHLNEVREVGRKLAAQGEIEITQRGVLRNPKEEIVGAIGYRLKPIL